MANKYPTYETQKTSLQASAALKGPAGDVPLAYADNIATSDGRSVEEAVKANDTAIADIKANLGPNIDYQIVDALPSEGTKGTIYLISNTEGKGDNIYDEYLYVNSSFEKIGSTDIDIDKYSTTEEIGVKLADYAKSADVDTKLNAYAKTADIDTKLADYAKTADTNTKLSKKQDTLTAGEGIKIEGTTISATVKAPEITIDAAISDTSENPVQNKAVKLYVDSKEYTDKNTYATDTADADALVTEIFGTGSSGGTVVPVDNSKMQEEIDGVYKKSNYNDGDNVVDFNTVHFILDNPEYLYAIVDADDKLLFGIDRETGTAVFGVIPEQIAEYVDNKIAEASKATATVSTTTSNE